MGGLYGRVWVRTKALTGATGRKGTVTAWARYPLLVGVGEKRVKTITFIRGRRCVPSCGTRRAGRLFRSSTAFTTPGMNNCPQPINLSHSVT
ncbi:hypothetical protein ACOMHN_023401 [Nucella lapillus]